MKTFFSVRSAILWATTAILLSACGAMVGGTIGLANRADQSSTRERIKALRAKQVEYLQALQAQGDPLGDYLFALANAEGWIGENRITDPVRIRDLYRAAAENGSSDAMIALGLMLFDGRAAPQNQGGVYLPLALQDVNEGLVWIERGMTIRCAYTNARYDASASGNAQCFVLTSPSGVIWPKFRDGMTRRNADGSILTVIKPNVERQAYWRGKDEACKKSQAVVTSQKYCPY